MFVITQGLLSPFLIVQGYGTASVPTTTPAYAPAGSGGGGTLTSARGVGTTRTVWRRRLQEVTAPKPFRFTVPNPIEPAPVVEAPSSPAPTMAAPDAREAHFARLRKLDEILLFGLKDGRDAWDNLKEAEEEAGMV